MPTSIDDLFVHNRAWAAQMERERPGFFTSLLAQQKPKYMWIGCSDSRVPAPISYSLASRQRRPRGYSLM